MNRKFTLIEMLVVIAIIGILLSILLPSLGRAKELTRRAVCLSNLKQCYQASVLYASTNNNKLNPTTGPHGTVQSLYWFGRITKERFKPYFDTWKITDCPSWEGQQTLGSGYPAQMRGSNMIGFIYSGGLRTSALVRGGGNSWTSPKTMYDDGNLMLWADRIVSSARWTGKYPHTRKGWAVGARGSMWVNPYKFGNDGGNVMNLNGSGKWVSQKIMTPQKADSGNHRIVNWWRIETEN